MPLWLSVNCALLHTSLLIGPISTYSVANASVSGVNPLCIFQGVLLQYSSVGTYAWLFLIALNL